MENIEKETVVLENEYYRVICMLSNEVDKDKWLAKIRVTRKDTNEYVKEGFTIYGNDRESVMKEVKIKTENELLNRLSEIGIPVDWDSDIRKILLNCKRVYSEIVEFSNCIEELKSKKNNEEKFFVRFAEFCNKLIKESSSIGRQIENLSGIERLELLTLPEYALEDPSDAWSLDEIDSRIKIYNFFPDPTNEETDFHNKQLKLLSDRFSELEWE